MPNIVIAGEDFQLRVYPRNQQGANFVYLEKDASYFIYEYTPLLQSEYGLGGVSGFETQCNCRP
jgi:hypothetical protein